MSKLRKEIKNWVFAVAGDSKVVNKLYQLYVKVACRIRSLLRPTPKEKISQHKIASIGELGGGVLFEEKLPLFYALPQYDGNTYPIVELSDYKSYNYNRLLHLHNIAVIGGESLILAKDTCYYDMLLDDKETQKINFLGPIIQPSGDVSILHKGEMRIRTGVVLTTKITISCYKRCLSLCV